MLLKPLDVLIFKGLWFNPITPIIYTRTGTTWTHCAIATNPGRMIEAVAKGVVESSIDAHGTRPYKVMRYRHEMHPDHVQAAIDWLYDQVETAKGYDFLALLGFLFGWKGFDEDDRFYCAELVPVAFQQAKVDLFNEIPTFVYPSAFVQHCDFKEITENEII